MRSGQGARNALFDPRWQPEWMWGSRVTPVNARKTPARNVNAPASKGANANARRFGARPLNAPARNSPMRNSPARNSPMRNSPMRNPRNLPVRNSRNSPVRNSPVRSNTRSNTRNPPARNTRPANRGHLVAPRARANALTAFPAALNRWIRMRRHM